MVCHTAGCPVVELGVGPSVVLLSMGGGGWREQCSAPRAQPAITESFWETWVRTVGDHVLSLEHPGVSQGCSQFGGFCQLRFRLAVSEGLDASLSLWDFTDSAGESSLLTP